MKIKNSIFPPKYTRYGKNVMNQNCSPPEDLKFTLDNCLIKKKKFSFLTGKIVLKINNFVFHQNHARYETIFIFKCKCGSNGYKIKLERKYYNKNMSLTADRALSKWNFLLHLKSKKSLVMCM